MCRYNKGRLQKLTFFRLLFRQVNVKDTLFNISIAVLSCVAVSSVLLVTGYVFFESADFLRNTSLLRFLLGAEWDPVGGETFEILPAILGTIAVSVLAVLISLPLAIGTSLFLCHYLRAGKKYAVSACIDVIAGIPSVIAGFAGMLTLVRFLEETGGLAAGESVLAAGIVLGFMLLPFEISFITESFDRLKLRCEAAALAIGFDRLYNLTHIVLPCSKGTVFQAALLALARGMGETMAVMMVIGNANLFPRLLGKSVTIPARIALEMGMAEVGSRHYKALFAAAFVLILMVFALNFAARALYRRTSARFESLSRFGN